MPSPSSDQGVTLKNLDHLPALHPLNIDAWAVRTKFYRRLVASLLFAAAAYAAGWAWAATDSAVAGVGFVLLTTLTLVFVLLTVEVLVRPLYRRQPHVGAMLAFGLIAAIAGKGIDYSEAITSQATGLVALVAVAGLVFTVLSFVNLPKFNRLEELID